MASLPRYFWLFFLGLLVVGLSGCTLARANRSGEISAADYLPPPGEGQVVQQQENTVIRLQPADQQLEVGNIVDVDILIDNVVELSAVDIQLSYDPTVVQVRDDDPDADGVQIRPGDFLSPDFVVDNEADNVTGDIFYAVTQTAPTTPVSGSGRLATARFQAVDQGGCQLIFTVAMLVRVTQEGSEQIPVTAQNGQIVVGEPTGDGTATPTATVTLTPTPTSTTGPGQDTPTPTPTGQTVTPSVTPTSTLPPVPTFTPLPSPTATPVPLAGVPNLKIPPSATEGFCYRVQEGDTLHSLGRQFGVDPAFLNLVNDLHPPGHTYLHQALFIPEIPGCGPNVYRVKVGDTLAHLSDLCYLPADFIAQVNQIEEDMPLFLRRGDTAVREDGSLFTAPEDMVIIERLVIPRPPFAPPSRYPYPGAVHPPIPPGWNTYPGCK